MSGFLFPHISKTILYENFQAQPNNSNQDKYLIVLSDGEATDPFNMVATQADRLKASGVTIVTVGVGKAVTNQDYIDQLLEIASDNKSENMFIEDNYDYLQISLLGDLSDLFCDIDFDLLSIIDRALSTVSTPSISISTPSISITTPSTTSNNVCTCDNGTPVSNKQCLVNGATACSQCDYGFQLRTQIGDCVCSQADFDLLTILIDSSGSLEYTNYIKSLDFVETVVDKLDLSTAKIRLVQFADGYWEYLGFSNDRKQIENAIERLRNNYSAGGTNTDIALSDAYNKFREQGQNSKNYLIVVTDGDSNDPVATQLYADNLKADGVTIFSVGMGQAVNNQILIDELLGMASEPKSDHMFTSDNFDDLQIDLLGNLAVQLCDIPTDSSSVGLKVSYLLYVFVAIWSILYM